MGLVGAVGRKRWRSRFAIGVVYTGLILGAITTLYPFLLMASTGFKGPTDQSDNRLVPEYWSSFDGPNDKGKLSDGSLLFKYLTDKYAAAKPAIDSTRTGTTASQATIAQYEAFLLKLPLDSWEAGFRPAPNQPTSRLTKLYQIWLKSRFASIDALNQRYIEENVGFQTVAPPSEPLDQASWRPRPGPKYPDWLEFKRTLPAEFRLPVRATKLFQDFLKSKFHNQFDQVPADVVAGAATFDQVRLPASGLLLDEFVKTRLPERFRNATVESQWAAVSSEPMPIEAYERQFLTEHASAVRREMAGRNFAYVFDYIALNGRALWNTIVFCGLSILVQLIVNPLAAYALSRYPIRRSGQILLLLLATMAFPAEVTMIPSFILLKQLHLLNTFAALVLPAAASGYMIFLLKGFFDSLPSELFEAAQLDGASETTMLSRIALPLSKPALGYLALVAFMAAYSAFMFAFVVAQDQRMWTLMVFLYQLQTVAPKSVVMAALTLAALPTVVVFLFAQRVIMRGVVLPGER